MNEVKNQKNILNNRKCILIAVILALINISIYFYFSNNKDKSNPVPEKQDIKKEEVQNNENITPIIPERPEEKWITYTNNELGFSIEYPEMVYGVYRCKPQKPFWVPLKVFEDNENGIVYITEEYYYDDWDSELQNNLGPCKKITNSFKKLNEERNNSIEVSDDFIVYSNPFLTRVFVFENITNENELDKFIKDNYGSECFINNKLQWNQNNIYEIDIQGKESPEGINPKCPLNYVYKVLYSPENNKAMSVKLGQECGFTTDYNSKDYICYDKKMIDSFEFN
ncbi:MAG: hypothetical protein P1P85_02730 [Patescibacteria group bacterium]|nr:hypothetical protein [Patescibacteria group bacterium]